MRSLLKRKDVSPLPQQLRAKYWTFVRKRMLEMSTNNRSIPFLLTVYVSVLGTLTLCAAYAYSTVTWKPKKARLNLSARRPF
jgi:hypothetical protein